METKGEFEQRPEVKPAEQIPLPKAKASPLPWILCAVFAVAAVGAGVFALGAINKNGPKTNCETALKDETNNENNTNPSDEKKDDGTKIGGFGGYVSNADSGDTFFVTNKGEAYFVLAAKSYSMKNTLKSDSALGERGNYSLTSEELGGYATIDGNGKASFNGYKLPYSNVVYTNELRFGNGDISRYIVVIDKSGKFYAIALDCTGGTQDTLEFTARAIGEISEYNGAVATLETNEGSGLDNIVYFKDGSYKVLDYKKFTK